MPKRTKAKAAKPKAKKKPAKTAAAPLMKTLMVSYETLRGEREAWRHKERELLARYDLLGVKSRQISDDLLHALAKVREERRQAHEAVRRLNEQLEHHCAVASVLDKRGCPVVEAATVDRWLEGLANDFRSDFAMLSRERDEARATVAKLVQERDAALRERDEAREKLRSVTADNAEPPPSKQHDRRSFVEVSRWRPIASC